MIFGTLLKLYQLLVPFAMRTAMIYLLGVQYLGLNGLFTSILSVLNLAELGVGSAMVYSMYKPIAEDDEETICALMQMYKIYYRIIGVVIMGIGLEIGKYSTDEVLAQPESAKTAISVMAFALPILLIAVSFTVYCTKYKLHGKFFDDVNAALSARKEITND